MSNATKPVRTIREAQETGAPIKAKVRSKGTYLVRDIHWRTGSWGCGFFGYARIRGETVLVMNSTNWFVITCPDLYEDGR